VIGGASITHVDNSNLQRQPLGIDQRGHLRGDGDDALCDIGAYGSGASPDTTKPTFQISVAAGPPATATISVQDAMAWLEQVVVTREVNATNLAPDFTVGQTTPGMVIFSKTSATQTAYVGVRVIAGAA
jgi:hypothetical protein